MAIIVHEDVLYLNKHITNIEYHSVIIHHVKLVSQHCKTTILGTGNRTTKNKQVQIRTRNTKILQRIN